MTDHHYRQLFVLTGTLAFLVWVYLLLGSVRQETREEMRREFVLDSSGAPVEVHREHVWELGKGFREPTQEEKDFEGER